MTGTYVKESFISRVYDVAVEILSMQRPSCQAPGQITVLSLKGERGLQPVSLQDSGAYNKLGPG